MRQRKADPARADDAAAARESALRLLTRREHGATELALKMRQRGFQSEVIASTIADLQSCDWQSDARYAAMMVRQRAASGYGPLYIERELVSKGIDSAAVDRALADLEADAVHDWSAIAVRQLQRRSVSDANAQRKAVSALYRRGFLREQIDEAVATLIVDADAPD
ncbi:regulatory protein RecX [Gammaproteobacteria bacterium]|nr:regulatory protein RecX [Gammaproteobacteria bacterium]